MRQIGSHWKNLIAAFLPDERLPRKTRLGLRAGILEIAQDPIGLSDATDFDATRRLVQIMVVGDYALTYWIDDADQHIKILDVHSADR